MPKYPVGKKQPDGKHVYQSKYTGEYVQAHQYIAEIMVNRKAFKQGVDLPYKYWNGDDKWAKEFRSQVTQAGKLMQTYHPQAIVRAIHDLKWCWSLRQKKMVDSIKYHDKIVKENEKRLEKETIRDVNTNTEYQAKPKTKKKSVLAKLRGINVEE